MTISNLSSVVAADTTISGELCVIGAGIAGLLLAHRIAKAGRRVIVIESGADHFDPDIHDMNAVEDISARYGRDLTGRYRGLGGSSTRWGGRLIPISSHDTGARDYIGMPAWPIDLDRLDAYGEEIERLFDVSNGPFDRLADVTPSRSPVLGSDENLGARWAKCPSFKKCNLSRVLRDPLTLNKNIEIWLEATVCDFKLERMSGTLEGIVAKNLSGKVLHVKADRFVLAAGTIETTRLMLLMNKAADGHIFPVSSALGHYFQDHLKVQVARIGRSNDVLTNRLFAYRYWNSTRRDLHLDVGMRAQEQGAAASAFAYIAMDLAKSPLAAAKRILQGVQRGELDFAELMKFTKNAGLIGKAAYWRLVRKQLFVPKDVEFSIMLCAEQLPHWKNRISLSQSCDRLGLPKALIEWQPMESEDRTLRVALAQLLAYWKAKALDRDCPLALTDIACDENGSIAASAEACAHPSGTTRMGTDPTTSVVGPDLRCHAVANLSVVSASVFPTAGSANPTFTIMKLAYFFADNYLARI